MGWAVYYLVVDNFCMGWLIFDLFVGSFAYREIAWGIYYTADFCRSQNAGTVCHLTRWAAVYNKEKVISCYDLVAACLNSLQSFFVAIQVAYLHISLLHYSAVAGT
jgi:hypothetical protein